MSDMLDGLGQNSEQQKGEKLAQFRLFSRHNQILCRRIIGLISLRFQIQTIFIDRLLHHGPVQHARLDEFTTRAELLHGFRLVELLLELLEGALDVVSFFDLNAEHIFLIGRQK